MSTESLYGTIVVGFFFPLAAAELAAAKAAMTFPRVLKDLLMLAPSFKRWPVAPVELALSEPARSTRLGEVCCGIEWYESDLLYGASPIPSFEHDAASPDSRDLLSDHFGLHVQSLLSQKDGEHRMTSRRCLVHLSRCNRSSLCGCQ